MEKLQVLVTQTEGERLLERLKPGTFLVIATTGEVRIAGLYVNYRYRQPEAI